MGVVIGVFFYFLPINLPAKVVNKQGCDGAAVRNTDWADNGWEDCTVTTKSIMLI